VRLPYRAQYLRPGGTVAGPMLMGLADFAMYVAVLSAIGRVELAVTTNLTCNFLRRPKPVDVVGDARLLKLGRRLAYGEVSLYSDGEQANGPVAHVTATYSIPPQR
jgi:acyl-coenzyme A thioesterase PaaI-like protein